MEETIVVEVEGTSWDRLWKPGAGKVRVGTVLSEEEIDEGISEVCPQ